MKQEQNYRWNAEEYARHSSVQQDWARLLIAKLALRGHESVLDVGCGDGKVTAEIAGQLPRGEVIGVDSSADMLKLAGRHFPQENHRNLSFQLADARHLPFAEQFDIVFSNAALHWLRDHRPVLAGIRKSLKPGGRILLQMGGKGNARAILSLLETVTAQEPWQHLFTDFEFPYGFHEPEGYREWLQEAGLQPVRVELIDKDMSYADKEGLAGWVRTTWMPYTHRVPASRREEFIGQLVEQYIEAYPPDGEGYVHIGMVRLEVEAIAAA